MNTIQLTPRTVTRWDNGAKTQAHNVTPTPFDGRRADEIWAKAKAVARGPVSDSMHKFMTDGEEAYVHAVWDAIPSGDSCYMDAFNMIRRNEV